MKVYVKGGIIESVYESEQYPNGDIYSYNNNQISK